MKVLSMATFRVAAILAAFAFLLLFLAGELFAFGDRSYVTTTQVKGGFNLVSNGKAAQLVASSADWPGVLRVLGNLQNDIRNVTGAAPELRIDSIPPSGEIVIVGTIGKSPFIDGLIRRKKIDVSGIAGRWETTLTQVVDEPFPGVARALVIAGSDKRGTIYGMYDLSEKIGVSPWYWWADVPVKKHAQLYIAPGRFSNGEPKVKYRGIFLNDEAPCLSGMAYEKFGGFNHKFYEHVFDLLLRLKANYLWPAMWNNSFDTDDTLNPKLADELGIVMGTSHHEPMMRAWKEWEGNRKGSWDYATNADSLRRYWKTGIERSKNYEEIVTLAMRGDGDEPMSEGENISLLQKIVADQRTIIANVTGKDVTTIPQVWALYKEVQDYYDKGMRVPDDVTLLLCDDNWGNVRRLPPPSEKPRRGGYGMYYHFDFVGGPRNYKWLNTNQIERVWDQMHLAYEYGVKQIWIVNVGDLKPMELPISFFLDYAWNPDGIAAAQLPEYYRFWATQQFGPDRAKEIGEILSLYTKYNARRKPELLSPGTYSLVDYHEAETVVSDYIALGDKTGKLYASTPQEYKDAFYELVLYPVLACSNLNNLYVTTAMNRRDSAQGRSITNELAEKASMLFMSDTSISGYYNRILAHGKWNHMADQTHIGYTNWQQPDKDVMPDLKEIRIPEAADMGVAIDGSASWWPAEKNAAVLPEFDSFNRQKYSIDIFNRGKTPFAYSITSGKPWIEISPASSGTIETEKQIWVSVQWDKIPPNSMSILHVPLTITGPGGSSVVVETVIRNLKSPDRKTYDGFVESNRSISIEAPHYLKAIGNSAAGWTLIPNLGRTLSAMSVVPVTARPQTPGGSAPHLEYGVFLTDTGTVSVDVYLSPTLNFLGNQGLRYAVSFDDDVPQIVNIHQGDTIPDWRYPQWWNQAVSNNIIVKTSTHSIRTAGNHLLKIWAVDPAVDLQKLVIRQGEIKPSYLGPPESYHRAIRQPEAKRK